jgi:tRNA (uracil-5-)-methyltransferase TRM9
LNDTTAYALNAINLAFYRERADEFDAARQRPWRGWSQLGALLRERGGARDLDVLDAGCGNGRLGAFLAAEGHPARRYFGVDASPGLLAHARARALPGAEYRIVDLVADDPGQALPAAAFSLVALFGVLHHVPGHERRRALLTALLERVAPGGLLVFSAWPAQGQGRGDERRVPWGEWGAGTRVDPAQLEPGDCLLAWGEARQAVRYCHFADDPELAGLLRGLSARTVAAWTGDDGRGWVNRYFALSPA